MIENMMDYMRWRGDLSISNSPLTPIDFLILSEIAYCPIENLEKGRSLAGRNLNKLSSLVYPEPPKDEKPILSKRYELWNAVATSNRFGMVLLDCYASHFDEEKQIQFAAVFFRFENMGIIAFRGTDSTLVGWHEDLRLAFESPIPAQKEAKSFVQAMVDSVERLYLCGHSKGGNLAMYAAVNVSPEIRQKIEKVYNFDGPGLDDSSLSSDGWQEMNSRIISYMPEASVVGKLLGYQTNYLTVVSDSISVLQHNPFNWHVEGPNFVLTDNSTIPSQYTDRALHDFLANCDMETRKVLVNTLFSVFQATGAKKMGEIGPGMLHHLNDVAATIKNVPPESRAKLSEAVRILAGSFGGNVPALIGMLQKDTDDP